MHGEIIIQYYYTALQNAAERSTDLILGHPNVRRSDSFLIMAADKNE